VQEEDDDTLTSPETGKTWLSATSLAEVRPKTLGFRVRTVAECDQKQRGAKKIF
jgi:hypothetical protein